MSQSIITSELESWYKFRGFMNDNYNNTLYIDQYPDSTYTIKQVKEWMEKYQVDELRDKINKLFNNYILDSEKTPFLLHALEKECEVMTEYINPKKIWRMYERKLYYFIKFIGEKAVNKNENPIIDLTIDINSDVITLHTTSLFEEKHMETVTDYFINTYGASTVVFKMVSKIY